MNNGSKLDRFTPTTLEDCITAPNLYLGLIAKAFSEGGEFTVRQMANKFNVARTTVRKNLDYLMQRKFVYLCRWDNTHTHAYAAVFKAGDAPNAALPDTKAVVKVKPPKEPTPQKEPDTKPFAAPLPPEHFVEMAAALVPVRTPEEQYEVNWNYWHHMARKAA